MSVKLMAMVYDAHFHDVTYTHTCRKRSGEEYTKQLTVLATNLKSICLALANYANDEGEGAYPSLTTLESKTELSRVTVVACIKAMKEQGIVTLVGISKRGTCNYTINKDKLIEMATWERQQRSKSSASKAALPVDTSKAALPVAATSKVALLEVVKPLYQGSKATLPDSLYNHPTTNNTGAIAPEEPTPTILTDEEKIARFYPEDIQEALRWFWELWRVPVPERSKNGRGGQHALWIKEMRLLVKVCGSHGQTAFEAAYKTWKRSMFTVSHPGAIYRTLCAEVGILNQRQTEQPVQEQSPVVEPLQSRNAPPPGWKEFKRRLEERHAQRSTLQS